MKAARTLLIAMAMVVVVASPAGASFNHTRVMEHDGQTVVVSQDVGNQSYPFHWVENDARRHDTDGLTLYYRIDQTELPTGISLEATEAAIESAVATFNDVRCARNFKLVRVPSDPATDYGWVQDDLGVGGSATLLPDITFAGWVSPQFFANLGLPDSLGVGIPIVYGTDDTTPTWGFDVLAEGGDFSDTNGDGKYDKAATEIYFNNAASFVVDDADLGNTLFHIDLESIILHELAHALDMDHFGRTKFIIDENGDLVDILINENSVNVMNTNNYFVKRELSGSDAGSFCGTWASWGKGQAG